MRSALPGKRATVTAKQWAAAAAFSTLLTVTQRAVASSTLLTAAAAVRRAINAQFFDAYQLKSMDTIQESDFKRFGPFFRNEEGKIALSKPFGDQELFRYDEDGPLLDADGTLVVFGRNENGQLGLGNRQSAWDDFNATNLCAPVHWQHERRLRAPLERPPGPVAQVACGGEHTVLLLATGQVMAFGSNTHGQLGRHFDSLWAMREDTPLRVPVPPGEQVVQVACGDRHTVMLLGNGTALAFGCNALGQLGTGRDPLDTEAFAMFQLALAHQDMEGAQRLLHSTLRYAHLTRPLLPYK